LTSYILALPLFLLIILGPVPLSLLFCSELLSVRYRASLPHWLLALLTIWSVVEISLGLFLGLIGQLNLLAVLTLEGGLFIAGLVLISASQQSASPSIQVNFKSSSGLSVGKAKLWFNTLSALLVEKLPEVRCGLTWKEILILHAIVLNGIYLFVTLATHPIVDFDSLWFHLPAIARWYQSGTLTLFDPAGNGLFEHPDATRYPYNWHILALLCLLPFRDDVLVALPIFLSWVMLGLSVYLLAVLSGAQRFYALAATALLLAMPMLMDRVNTLHVDLPFAAIFIVSLYFAYSCHKTRSPTEFTLCLMSLGLLIGIKITGILYAGSVGIFLGGLELQHYWFHHSSTHRLRQTNFKVLVWLGIGSFLLLSCVWYVRNFWELHTLLAELLSPQVASLNLPAVAPRGIDLHPLFTKFYYFQRSTLTHQFNPAKFAHWQILASQYFSRLQLPFVAMLVQVVMLPYICIKHPKQVMRSYFFCLIFLFLLSWFLYWNTPYSSGTDGSTADSLSPLLGYNLRYGFSFIAMLAVLTAVVATIAQTPIKVVLYLVWLSGLFGIISACLFDAIRTQNFIGDRAIWLSGLLQNITNNSEQITTLALSVLWNNPTVVVDTIAYIAAAGLLMWLALTRNRSTVFIINFARYWQEKKAALVLIAGIILLLPPAIQTARAQNETIVYGKVYQVLEQQVTDDRKIAYFSSHRNYLFYGNHFEQTVLHSPPYPQHPDTWIKDLQAEDVEFVATGPLLSPKSKRGELLNELTAQGKLLPVLGKDFSREVVIYRLRS
jgi:hypothetical protein